MIILADLEVRPVLFLVKVLVSITDTPDDDGVDEKGAWLLAGVGVGYSQFVPELDKHLFEMIVRGTIFALPE